MAALFDDKLNALSEVGEHFILPYSAFTKNQVACTIHNYNKSKKRNPTNKSFSYKQSKDGYLVILMEIEND